MAVFGKHRGGIAVEVKWKASVILNSARDPKTRRNLVANATANRVALILRIREMTGELRSAAVASSPRNRPPVTGNQALPTV